MGSGVNNRDVRAQDWGGFANDDWRVTDRLTFTLGIRYDFFGPFTEAQGRFVGFDPTRITTATIPGFPAGDNVAITGGFVQASNAKNPLPGIPMVQSSLVPSDKNNFAPRVGFAWQPLSNTKRFVVRGGYGIYYDRANSRLLNNQLLNFPYYTLAQHWKLPSAIHSSRFHNRALIRWPSTTRRFSRLGVRLRFCRRRQRHFHRQASR